MRYTIEISFDERQYKLIGFMSVENYDVDEEFLLFRLENNFERNQLLYHKKEEGICIKKILDSKMCEIDYEILQLECKRFFCQVRTNTSKIYVQYEIPIKIIDGCIRLEDSVYGGLSCYPRLVNTKNVRRRCLDYEKGDYVLSIRVPDGCNVIASGMATKARACKERWFRFEAQKTSGMGLIVAINTDYMFEYYNGVFIGTWYFIDKQHNCDYVWGKKVQSILKEGITHMTDVMGFFPCRQIMAGPGNPFFGGGYATSNLIFINYGNDRGQDELNMRKIIFHELAHMYFGYYLNDDNYFGKCISKGLSVWFEGYIGEKYYGERCTIPETCLIELNLHPICYYEQFAKSEENWNQFFYHDLSHCMIQYIYHKLGEEVFLNKIKKMLESYVDKIMYFEDFLSEIGIEELASIFVCKECKEISHNIYNDTLRKDLSRDGHQKRNNKLFEN